MEKKKVEKIEQITEGIDTIAGLGSILYPPIATIPIITFAIRRVTGFISEERIIERINKLVKKLNNKKITVDQFKIKVSELSEHNEYIIRNNLNNIILTSIPETVDAYIEVVIDLIMNQKDLIYEELCEAINQLNKNDIELLMKIKEYQLNGSREYYLENRKRASKIREKNARIEKENKIIEGKNQESKSKQIKMPTFEERNIDIGQNTIFWEDFSKLHKLHGGNIDTVLLIGGINSKGERTIKWAYIAKAFLKLERLGIIEIDYNNTLGTISNLNINRFHITLIGQKLLTYIK